MAGESPGDWATNDKTASNDLMPLLERIAVATESQAGNEWPDFELSRIA